LFYGYIFPPDSYIGIYHYFVNGYDHMITKLLSPNLG